MNNVVQNNSTYIFQTPTVFREFEQYTKIQLTTMPDSFSPLKNANKTEFELQFEAVQQKQGFIGKNWDAIKNKFNLKNSSNSINKKIDDYKKGLITEEEITNSVKKYIKGQTQALDFIADWGSTIAGASVFAISLPLVASSVSGALCCAAIAGGIFKTSVKYADAKSGDRKYNTGTYDLVTGGINGLLSPIVNGIGSAISQATAKGTGAIAARKTITKIINSRNFDEIVRFFALYNKKMIQEPIKNTLSSVLLGKSIKTVSKFGLAFILRELTFLYFKTMDKKSTYSTSMNAILKFTGIENDPRVKEKYEKSLDKKTKEADLSNDVYNTKNNKENS